MFVKTLKSYRGKAISVSLLHGKMVSDRTTAKNPEMPVHCLINDSVNGGSMVLEPLKTTSQGQTRSLQEALIFNLDEPRVLIKISLEEDAGVPNVKKWDNYLTSNMPPFMSRVDISIEGSFKSESSLLIISVPVAIWSTLQPHPAYEFIAFVNGRNELLQGRRVASSSEETVRRA
jgi:hypothetical protein